MRPTLPGQQGLTTSFLNYNQQVIIHNEKVIFLLVFYWMINDIPAKSVGIGTTTPNASAALVIKGNT